MYWIEFGWAFLQFTFQKSAPYCWYGLFLCAKWYFGATHLCAFVVTHEKKSKINLIYISMWMHSERNAHNYIISHISISLILGKNRVFWLQWLLDILKLPYLLLIYACIQNAMLLNAHRNIHFIYVAIPKQKQSETHRDLF